MTKESKTPQLDALAKLLTSAINRAYDHTELMILVPIANQWIDAIRADLIAGAALEAEKGSCPTPSVCERLGREVHRVAHPD